MRLIITGPPAAGKGSLAPYFVKEYNIKHISTGVMFREEIKTGSARGKKIKKLLDKGQLVDDKYTNQLVEERLLRDDVKDGFLLDGYPRTIAQAKFLDGFLKTNNIKLDYVVSLKLDDNTIVKRIVGRRVCPRCGRNYNIYFTKPATDNICDFDGEVLTKRDDDTEQIALERIKVYHKETEPIIDYYKKQGLVIVADGGHLHSYETFDEVRKQIGDNK